MTPAATTRTIVAVTGEDDRYRALRTRATTLADDEPTTVILYDLDAGGLFASPVPTGWSGEGERELTNEEAGPADRLGPDELETAGRAPIAEQVRALRATGVDAWAWLPTSRDARDLAAYAERQGAALVLVPPDLERPGLLDRVAGHAGAAEADAGSPVPFETVG
jgi:hypothetical protein